ncbi:AAA family ATPase [Kribbella italica]|uniref:Energy-coupling factor transporter ATP-binding protein EcfA2 n=1 Tax=Kribbella italica TaxID=1540520 RepID=A0A7W9J0M6_9ACTN|nr:AAA family ATPase [Kribbella italica]MBB5833464.1 energy-coupling factor transporter ATP-binding protein EcfA2 [Kribbella italica]
MTTDTGAKGKGFWRRRRRKTEAVEPEATPAVEPTPGPATESTADPKPSDDETVASADADAKPAADEAVASPDADAEPAADEATTPAPADAKPAADEASAPAAADAEPAADESTEESAEPTAAAESAPKDAAAAPSNKSAEGDEPKPADAVEPGKADEAQPDSKDEPTDEKASEDEDDRPAVGVTYEPEESPDGFPLEYGEIIIGLPKGGEVPESERMVDPQTVAAEVPDDKPEKAAAKDSAEEPATEAEKEEPATEEAAPTEPEPEDTDEASDEADLETEAADEPVEEVAPAADESVEESPADDAEASDTDEASDEVAPEEEIAPDEEAVSAEEVEAEEEAAPDEEAEPEVVLSAEELAAKAAEQQAAMALITALMKLRGALADSKLPLDVVGADEARQQRKAMLDQLDDYVLPRLVQLEAPVLAVVGGSTGAGKSTLVNSLIGQVVSEPGVLRPTTRSPVLIHHPADAEWFAGDRVLPGMARSSGDSPGGMEDPGQIRLVAADTIPRGLAVLDAPDIDSVVEANRDLATQLLAAADLWLFVTTAARYADAVPWEFLQSASDRSTAVAVVLDRAPADTIDDITGHLAQMLLERGLGDSPLFSIKETVVDDRGMLPNETVASIKDWLIDLAADAEARSAVVRRTLQGAVTAMTKKTPAFSKAVRDQADTFVELRANAETAYERGVKDIAKATQDGTMLRGEVLARWQEFVGTGELLKGLQTNVGRMRDKVRASIVGKPPPTRDLNDAVESGLESLLREHAEAAAERAEESWQSTAAGRQLLAAGERDLGRMSKDFPASAGRAVREWQGFVLDLVRKEGADKRSTARILAYGVNGLGLSLMVVIFASTAGITGAEVGVGAGTAVVGQKLLEAVFGDQAVRTLAAKARQDLDDRVHALMDAEFARYLAVLDQHPVDPEAPRQLTEAARAVEDCT